MVRVPAANLLEIPDSVSMEAVAMHKRIRMVLNDGFLTGRMASGRTLSSNASAEMKRWYKP